MIRNLDRDLLREQFQNAKPFPHVAIDGFLEESFAREVAASYPSFETARALGDEFRAVNEYKKIQVTDSAKFPHPVQRLNELLASPALLEDLAYITGIEGLGYDPTLAGGGMHVTGPRGRLDVHVDFNYLEEKKLYRRLNLLLYLNPVWERAWGGAVEIWDEKVETCHGTFAPSLNRCVIFETSERSFHGVEEVRCPPGFARQSFAVYYYTPEPPADYQGFDHTTIFRARPDERLKKYVLMPAEEARQALRRGRQRVGRARRRIEQLLSR